MQDNWDKLSILTLVMADNSGVSSEFSRGQHISWSGYLSYIFYVPLREAYKSFESGMKSCTFERSSDALTHFSSFPPSLQRSKDFALRKEDVSIGNNDWTFGSDQTSKTRNHF